jgi:Phosphoesterase family
MSYMTRDDIPYHCALADAFTVVAAYYCSIMEPTNPNRCYLWTGCVGNVNYLGIGGTDGLGAGPVTYNGLSVNNAYFIWETGDTPAFPPMVDSPQTHDRYTSGWNSQTLSSLHALFTPVLYASAISLPTPRSVAPARARANRGRAVRSCRIQSIPRRYASSRCSFDPPAARPLRSTGGFHSLNS